MTQEKVLLTNLKINDMVLNQKEDLCQITMASDPKKAGKHGSAKIFYNYTVLYSNNKVQAVGKSRDQLVKVHITKLNGDKVFQDDLEITFIDTNSGELLLYKKENFINLNNKDKKEIDSNFYYFIYNSFCFYQNK
jgi:translation elongation factor P/translation initiation factor 5A